MRHFLPQGEALMLRRCPALCPAPTHRAGAGAVDVRHRDKQGRAGRKGVSAQQEGPVALLSDLPSVILHHIATRVCTEQWGCVPCKEGKVAFVCQKAARCKGQHHPMRCTRTQGRSLGA